MRQSKARSSSAVASSSLKTALFTCESRRKSIAVTGIYALYAQREPLHAPAEGPLQQHCRVFITAASSSLKPALLT